LGIRHQRKKERKKDLTSCKSVQEGF